jgi:hypothetical protein
VLAQSSCPTAEGIPDRDIVLHLELPPVIRLDLRLADGPVFTIAGYAIVVANASRRFIISASFVQRGPSRNGLASGDQK